MKPSSYQTAILDWLVNGKGNGCCNAVAGSGKSTTLKLGALKLQEAGLRPSECKIIVFGKANSLDLIAKFGSEWKDSISTLHSAGWSLLKDHLQLGGNTRNLIKSIKYKTIAQDQGFIAKHGGKGTLKNEGAIDKEADFVKLIDLVRLTHAQPTRETIIDICQHFEIVGVWKPDIIGSVIDMVLKIGENMATNGESFDFTDQIWLPVKWKLAPKTPYKFVLVDECQDLNAAQLELSLQLAGKKGRLLFVGDPRQAIMGFAGADNRSYQKIVDRTKARELPLSICYRCPAEHIKLVKRIFPEIPIEPAENAATGSIIQCEERDLDTHLKVGDMVISRKTAPLVSLCIKLIAKGIKATVKGRDIGETIKRDLEAIAEVPGFSYEKFNEAVNAYQISLFARYEGFDNEEQLKESLRDKLEALSTIYTSQPNAKSINDLGIYIDSLFSDETSPITLSTCHRAKGLEGKRIFLHRAEDMPMRWKNQLDWQLEQEMNLLYVALTRAQNELFIVGDPNWLVLDDQEPEEKGATENIYSETEPMEAATQEVKAEIFADSTDCNVEYIAGQESHSSTWAKFWIVGLEKWGVRESDDIPNADKHSSFHQFVCLDVPENQVFTVFEQDGDKRGTDDYKFFICKASRQFGDIKSAYTPNRHCTGNFEIICEGIGKTKAPRLFDWWISYVGDKDQNKRTNDEKLGFADHCLAHINRRGIKALPKFEAPIVKVDSPPDDVIDPRLKFYLDEETPPSTDSSITKQWVNLGLIILDGGTQSRKETDQGTIDDYAEQMSDGRWNWDLEPLPLLFFDGENHFPGDGHHRILAASQVREDIYCELRSGTLRDAIFHSCQANRFHGLQRTRADKRNQVELILKDAEWQSMSDRAIADHCGVSAPFVGNVRRELVESGTVNIFSERTDKKGRTIKTANIGTKGRREDGSIDRRSSSARSNSSPDKPDTSTQISKNFSTPISQPPISENLVDALPDVLERPALPESEYKTTQADLDHNAKLQKESPIAPFDQKVIQQACKVWSAKTAGASHLPEGRC